MNPRTSGRKTPASGLFQRALLDRWSELPPEVRRLHTIAGRGRFVGVAKVERGSGFVAALAAWFFGFPRAGDRIPLTLTKYRARAGEVWERNFGGAVFQSYCTPSNRKYHYRERFWLFNFEQELPVEAGAMYLPVRRGWFLGVPIPRPLLPQSDSKEFAADGRFCFDVSLGLPLSGAPIVRYSGWLSPEKTNDA